MVPAIFLVSACCLLSPTSPRALAGESSADLAQEGAPAAAKDATAPPSWKPFPFTLKGGAYLWHYEPLVAGADSNTELYAAYLTLDVPFDEFNFHVEPRFRDSKLRPFFTSNVWFQEIYLDWKIPALAGGSLKAGKIYSRFGRFWDGSFFGNVPYLDGLKLDPDMGLSFEGKAQIDEKIEAEYAVQFFTVDGSTNGSLQDRDTLSYAGARERNVAVARVAPRWKFDDEVSASIGLSGQSFEADFNTGSPDDNVQRAAVDLELVAGSWTVFGEFTRQWGRSVLNYPILGSPSDDNEYWWAGIERRFGPWSARYNFSTVNYRDVGVRETIHQPGLVYDWNEHVRLYFEFDYWDRNGEGGGVLDRSLNFILNVNF